MKTNEKVKDMDFGDFAFVLVILVIFFMLIRIPVTQPEEKQQENYTTQAGTNCMIVKISHAGTEELRRNSTMNLKMDYAVCMNDRGEAVIDTSYDNFVNTVIAEYDEWRQ